MKKNIVFFLLSSFIPLVSVLMVSCHKIERDEDGKGDGLLTVLEYCPAPGQFINLPDMSVCKDDASAAKYAEGVLRSGRLLSLGAFGGYVTVRMPKYIENRKGPDFAIAGNPHKGSSEPGIVWVSEDVNGNGLADDPWYELAGSEESVKDYSVTYGRPSPEDKTYAADVPWTDNRGGSGIVKYVSKYHAQVYYPLWIESSSYTLTGSLLKPRTSVGDGGFWSNDPFEWGYADNFGNDAEFRDESGAVYMYNVFDLDNAVDGSGRKVRLSGAHFVKVQSAVLMNAGDIGEVSTEIRGFYNL